MYFDARAWLVVWCACAWGVASARGWRWPEGAESVRIDTKVRFLEDARQHQDNDKRDDVQSDEVPFREPTDTGGFYNRPPGAGRYPVRVEANTKGAYRVDTRAVFPVQSGKGNDGTVDSIQFCKCVTTNECNPRSDSAEICGHGKFLCCYKRPNKSLKNQNTEFFNEIDDERPMLFPGRENVRGPFPPPPGDELSGDFGIGHGHETVLLGAIGNRDPDELYGDSRRPVVIGPGGPTGSIGPSEPKPVLVGPGGPTGIVGPQPNDNRNIDSSESAQRGVLVGPGGPTGIIGPYNQRQMLTGPGGPTGIIGPGRGGSRGVLVGPGGPNGIIGPGYGRQQGPGLLVGPGGPTGIIGPGRQLLVGPGGPTGHIGPQRYFVHHEHHPAYQPRKTSNESREMLKDEKKNKTCHRKAKTTTKDSTTTTTKTTRTEHASRVRRAIYRVVPAPPPCNTGNCGNAPKKQKWKQAKASKNGCSRADNSCGGKNEPKDGKQKQRGVRRRSGGDVGSHGMDRHRNARRQGISEREEGYNPRHDKWSYRALETADPRFTTMSITTPKPGMFRYMPNYIMLLFVLRGLLGLGVV